MLSSGLFISRLRIQAELQHTGHPHPAQSLIRSLREICSHPPKHTGSVRILVQWEKSSHFSRQESTAQLGTQSLSAEDSTASSGGGLTPSAPLRSKRHPHRPAQHPLEDVGTTGQSAGHPPGIPSCQEFQSSRDSWSLAAKTGSLFLRHCNPLKMC